MSFTFGSTEASWGKTYSTAPGMHEVTRANLYHVLGRAFASPLEMNEQDPQQLEAIFHDLADDLVPIASELHAAWTNALEEPEALSLAYARQFLGPFQILTSPYASFYLEPEQRLMGEVSQYVARFYADAGLGPGSGPHEAPDHVALEWEFMYFLTYQYLDTGEERWLEQRESFRSSHLDRWIPSLAKALADTAEHPFYRALAAFLLAMEKKEPVPSDRA